MGDSLQEQMLKAGLVDKNKATKNAQAKRKKNKQKRKGQAATVNEPVPAPDRQAEQAARDRELNRQQQQQQQQRAAEAQIRQLIETNRLTDSAGDLPYNFTLANKIKRLHVSEACQRQLAKGQLAIALLDGQFALVPRETGEKIQQRDPARVVLIEAEKETAADPEDPYAGYEVPDDLMW